MEQGVLNLEEVGSLIQGTLNMEAVVVEAVVQMGAVPCMEEEAVAERTQVFGVLIAVVGKLV